MRSPSLSTEAGPFTFGIEEEYFIAEARTMRMAARSRPKFINECKAALGGIVEAEMMQSQIEIATPVLDDMAEALRELHQARTTIGAIGARHGLSIAAAGTYPLATWNEQQITPKRRYKEIREELQIVGRRNVLCGLHIHVAPPENSSRVDLMNRAMPFLPLLLALSTSSPFWQKHRTGMKGYRLAAYDELPRTGLPAIFRNEGDYHMLVDLLVKSGAVNSEAHIWWAIRPSSRYPTLELRIADSCTYAVDAVCVAALFRCLIRALWRNPTLHADIVPMHRLVIDENRWRAQRFGIHGSLIDINTGTLRSIAEVLDGVLDLVAEDAEALNCRNEVAHAKRILARGTSADLQLEIYANARDKGLTKQRAVHAVADWLTAATQQLGDDIVIPQKAALPQKEEARL
ncbi:MAG: carboxylate-amine ligase [Rhodospirillaceae bacterium]|nr:carboxylate-amine ligase [Rhodospirillaceae bacterium]